MKKSLIALAIVAASGAAMAQSSVTVFGRVDAWLGKSKDTFTGASLTKLDNGGLTGSRWGLQGTEDLGGGLKAMFKIENRFNVDTGTDTAGFSGDSYLGLGGGFGTVYLGRTYTAYDGVKAISVSSSVFDSAFTPNAMPAYQVRGDNGIKYVSPDIGGLTVAANISLSETAGTSDTMSLSGIYGAGPLKAGLAFEDAPTGNNTALSAAYDFGMASVSAGYGTFKAESTGTGNDASGFNIGVTVPMGALKASLGYANGKTETQAGVKVSDYSGWAVAVGYSLSKRTTAYAGYNDIKKKDPAGAKITGSSSLYAVGIRHDF